MIRALDSPSHHDVRSSGPEKRDRCVRERERSPEDPACAQSARWHLPSHAKISNLWPHPPETSDLGRTHAKISNLGRTHGEDLGSWPHPPGDLRSWSDQRVDLGSWKVWRLNAGILAKWQLSASKIDDHRPVARLRCGGLAEGRTWQRPGRAPRGPDMAEARSRVARPGFRELAQAPAAAFRSATRSVRSHVRSGSSRPK